MVRTTAVQKKSFPWKRLYFRLPASIRSVSNTDIYIRSLHTAEDGDMNKLEQKLIMELTALPNVRWWHRNIARQDSAINGFIKHYPGILITAQSGKLICAEIKGKHLKNDDDREKVVLGTISMSQSIDMVKKLQGRCNYETNN